MHDAKLKFERGARVLSYLGMLFYYLRAALIFLSVLSMGVAAGADWSPLWNGRDLEGWTTWLAKPHPSAVLPGEPRDTKGNYTQPIGSGRDPLG
ncbi:MAG: hypothetical protein ORN83_12720, partial [Chthoniobacteraceae bacterium]|nr:hypothetical protein [Chthoniobacteraceae bacterium]